MRNKTFKQRENRRRGAAAIEFGLWMPILAILLSGLVDLSWFMSRYHLVQRATMDGVRFGIRKAAEEDTSDAQGSKQVPAAEARALSVLSGFGLSSPTVNATLIPNGGGCPFDRLEMDTTVDFQPLIGFIPMPTVITADFAMMSEIQR